MSGKHNAFLGRNEAVYIRKIAGFLTPKKTHPKCINCIEVVFKKIEVIKSFQERAFQEEKLEVYLKRRKIMSATKAKLPGRVL